MKNIFISSTFIDMQAERDMVQERVLPALREEARKYGDNVGVIDLRWGVDTLTLETEEGAAKVLKVCLDEIDRSHPYMLIFLGERYGTMMREDQIEKSVRGREDKYITDDYVKSITALEVEYGALSEKYGELNHCVVCFREPVVHMLDGAEKDLYAEHKEEGKRKLEALKERIKHDLGEEDRLITYSCTWDPSARQLVNFVSKGQPLENVLTTCFAEMFKDDWKEYEDLSWQDKEQLAFRALMESKVSTFVGREELLEEYYRSTVNGTCPIILQGETGSGKTAIMCKIVERLQKEGKNVFAFFSGTGSMSTNADSLVRQMVYYMENLLGIEEHFGETEAADETDGISELERHSTQKHVQYDDWMEHLGELCFGLAEGEKVYFCIDALDQLFLDEHVEELDFFVKGKKVQIVASCTDTFALPVDVMADREVKYIPALSEQDARMVAEGILASYSRNAYVAIEEEILKKKSTGNPLYISLLIQRLNMMDTEELHEAMTEEEIVALGVRIIKEMPEETEEAIVSVIRDGIEKISEEQELLFETLQYLAISRNGLRMSDLQGIFAAQGRMLPTLDITLLMKYLDSFFYVHEDDRIDFTHKVIRQGLLKVLTDRDAKEEAIKEHLKTLDTTDGLRMREGMYFARIQKDEEFARELIEQAYLERDEELVKAIKNEMVADNGDFYCKIIEKETREVSLVRKFFLWWLSWQLGLAKEEMQARLRVGESLVLCQEQIHEKKGSDSSLRDLSISYNNMGCMLKDLEQSGEALVYYEKLLVCMEQLHKKYGSEMSLRDLSISYNNMDAALKALGQSEETLVYYEKLLVCMEQLHEKYGSEMSLQYLSNSYNNMGRMLKVLGQSGEALVYYEKGLRCRQQLHERKGSEGSLRELSISYNNMGHALNALGRSTEALVYYEKGLRCIQQLHERKGSEGSLRELSSSYNNMGHALNALGRSTEALVYYEKALQFAERMYGKNGVESSLRVLAISYYEMYYKLLSMGMFREAMQYQEKALKCEEQLREKGGSTEV